jgi:hypothetical protein
MVGIGEILNPSFAFQPHQRFLLGDTAAREMAEEPPFSRQHGERRMTIQQVAHQRRPVRGGPQINTGDVAMRSPLVTSSEAICSGGRRLA